jgi:hypothetical protein
MRTSNKGRLWPLQSELEGPQASLRWVGLTGIEPATNGLGKLCSTLNVA